MIGDSFCGTLIKEKMWPGVAINWDSLPAEQSKDGRHPSVGVYLERIFCGSAYSGVTLSDCSIIA